MVIYICHFCSFSYHTLYCVGDGEIEGEGFKMIELRTLKDMNKVNQGWKLPENEPIDVVRTDELKAEAVKWVGKCSSMIDSGKRPQPPDYQIAWIKHFFNLTSEDLKSKNCKHVHKDALEGSVCEDCYT